MYVLAECDYPTKGRKCGFCVEYITLFGMTMLRIKLNIPIKSRRRSRERCINKAAEYLKSAHVTGICFQNEFSFRHEFLNYGFYELDERPIISASAGQIITLSSENHDTVLFYAGCLGKNEVRALEYLCKNFRNIVISIPEYYFDSACVIASKYGVSPVKQGKHHLNLDAAVFFCAPERPEVIPENTSVLFMDGRGAVEGGKPVTRIMFSLPERYVSEIPDNYQVLPIAAAAFTTGKLQYEKIAVKSAGTGLDII